MFVLGAGTVALSAIHGPQSGLVAAVHFTAMEAGLGTAGRLTWRHVGLGRPSIVNIAAKREQETAAAMPDLQDSGAPRLHPGTRTEDRSN